MINGMTKEESDQWFLRNKDGIAEVKKEKYRLSFHLMPQVGFLNDPNGLMERNGRHHIYFQYCPYNVEGTIKCWGHYTTKDYNHYRREKIALYPDSELDRNGVYSGSAFVKDDKIHFFYTGNVKKTDSDNYDYITSGRISNVVHTVSEDGYSFSEKECLLTNEDYPEDISNHVRDPKILDLNGIYYMVLGARNLKSEGCVLVYESSDLHDWKYSARIEANERIGYMWECPDLFYLNGQLLLIDCPQGVEGLTEEFENNHQACYMVLDAQPDQKKWKIKDICILDRGTDFYAPQTYLDEKRRRICIAWMGRGDSECEYPSDGWKHALTLARQLKWENGKLIQQPLEEYKQLRKGAISFKDIETFNQSEIKNRIYEWQLRFSRVSWVKLKLRADVDLLYKDEKLTLSYTGNVYGRKSKSVEIDKLDSLQIFSDVSSLEIFVNDGEEVFTTRVFDDSEESLNLSGQFEMTGNDYYELKGFTYEESC